MTIRRNRFLLTTTLAMIGISTTTALADEWNKETILQFSAPVEVPGRVLQPGKYVFRLADSYSNRNIVQIYSEDEKGNKHFVTTFLTIPAYRLETPDKPVIQFEERRAGDPEAIKRWFYPGDNTGWQFTYPKSERLEASALVTVPDPPADIPAAAIPEPPAVVEPAAEATPAVIEEEEATLTPVERPTAPSDDSQKGAERVLPETAGQSATILGVAIAVLLAGLAAVSMSLCKAE